MHRRPLPAFVAVAVAAALVPSLAAAADAITITEVRSERATVHTAGVQVLIADDDNHDASIEVRVREVGAADWIAAPPLFRVLPATVGIAVPEQLAGSIFDLAPGTDYEVELHVVDPDGVDETMMTMVSTRALPADPAAPNPVAVADAAGLSAALAAAAPGDVITLAAGSYAGNFAVNAGGTADAPIVIRGADAAGVVLDGQGCTGCNVLEVYGEHTHVEDLTIAHGERALRFQGDGATGNVVRRVVIADVIHGIGSRPNQTDFYICDNDIRGRLDWPWVFDADASAHWDDRGVDLNGDGHVICHNRIEGFGDPIVNLTEGYRAFDVYGNEIVDCFDGIEADRGTGNVRIFRNRWTNVDSAISIQPINGGPLYVVRNELLNVVSEQIKMKMTGGEPSGSIILHNTFVSGDMALNLQTPITGHNFRIENNLFVGPQTLTGARTVEWTAGVDGGVFDSNGYFPDGGFWFGVVGGTNRVYDDFGAAMASGEVEGDGVLLADPIFASGALGPTDEMAAATPVELELADGSNAIDVGHVFAGIGDGFMGAGPDLGAREQGCAAPAFGPRPADQEGVVSAVNCPSETPGGTDDGGSESGADGSSSGSASGDASGSGSADGSASGSGSATAGDSGSGSASGGTEGGANDGGGGCSCKANPRGSLLGIVALVGLIRRRRLAVAMLCSGACGSPSTGSADATSSSSTRGTTTTGGASSSESDDATSSSPPAETSSSEDSTTGAQSCVAQNPNFDCEPIDCADPIYGFTCGPGEMFDDQGCMRPWCYADDECPDGTICYEPTQCDPRASGCTPLTGCGMVGDECQCGAVGGCEDPPTPPFRGWCIDPADKPC